MNILITGGAGSLGMALLKEIDSRLHENVVVRVFDNNEHALSKINYPFVRKTYGSIADLERLRYAMRGTNMCIHCAAMKNIEVTEYNPHSVIETNITGTDNVAMAAIINCVENVMFISSDKAVEPINLYGVSKLAGEHIVLRHNETQPDTRFSVFRSGNFEESNGCAKEVWARQTKNKEPLTITELDCERYYIPTEVVAHEIMNTIQLMEGGEIFIPNECILIPKTVRTLLNEAYGHIPYHKIIGLRKGEKMYEKLCTTREHDALEPAGYTDCNVIRSTIK